MQLRIVTHQTTAASPPPSLSPLSAVTAKAPAEDGASRTMSSDDDISAVPDPYAFLGLTRNPDGSITRPPEIPPAAANQLIPVLTKDISVNTHNKIRARIYLPRPEPGENPPTKLPLIVYYHGGGFILGSATSSFFQKFCCNIVHQIPAVMVSVDYRLAPEHRLPAAYDDGFDALQWIKTTDEEWLTKFADLSRCFVIGTSAGGNIAFHVGLRAAAAVDQLKPLKIQGLVLQHTFLGGVGRAPSEIRCGNDPLLPMYASDLMWDLALPVGADRDSEYSNQTKQIKSEVIDKVKNQGWKIMVTGCDGDPLSDRQIELAKMLREKGVDVRECFRSGGSHGVDFLDDYWADLFYDDLKNFILSF